MMLDDLADVRQHGPQFPDAVVLALVLALSPMVVIPVLAAPGRVGPDRLDMPLRVDADPYVFPGGRDHQRLDPPEHLRVADRRTV